MWRRIEDLPDVHHEQMENVYRHFVNYLDKHGRETGDAITLNAALQALLAMWVANYGEYLQEAEQEADEMVEVFRSNLLNMIDEFKRLKGFYE